MSRDTRWWKGLLVAPLALAACTGMIESGPDGPRGAPERPLDGVDGGPPPVPQDAVPGPDALRRLSRTELGYTLEELVGLRVAVDELPADESAAGFDNQAGALSISPLHVEMLFALAGRVATRMLADPAARARFVVGDPEGDPRGAARASIERFATRAYRRPASAEEVSALVALFDQASTAGLAWDAAIAVPIRAVLASPLFYFHAPLHADDGGEAVALDAYALASRLSFFLWSSGPDDALLEAAASGALGTPEGLRSEAERMLADARSRRFVESFAGQWLDLRALPDARPDPALFPDFDETLRASMAEETLRSFAEQLTEGAALDALLTGRRTWIDARLARHYGLPVPAGGGFAQVSLEGSERVGFLTQGSFLTLTSHPDRTSLVRRGKWVLEQLLCAPPPPPPPGVEALPIDDGETPQDADLRTIVERHRSDPACSGCHARMDPIGFGLEHFDGIGAFRTDDRGYAIDGSGELLLESGGTARFEDAIELSALVASDPRFPRCVTQKVLTFALSREPTSGEAPLVDRLAAELDRDGSMRELLLGVVLSSSFTHAAPQPAL